MINQIFIRFGQASILWYLMINPPEPLFLVLYFSGCSVAPGRDSVECQGVDGEVGARLQLDVRGLVL